MSAGGESQLSLGEGRSWPQVCSWDELRCRGMKGTKGTAFPSHMCPRSHRSKAEPQKHRGGAHTLHPTVIQVAQCSERAPGPHGSSHRPSHVPTARCCLCMEHSGCCCVGRGREAAAGRCLQRETQREALHGGEGPRAAIHRCKTPWGAAAEWGKWDHRPIPTLQQRPWGPTMPPSPSGCPLPSLCGTWWLWGGGLHPRGGEGQPLLLQG